MTRQELQPFQDRTVIFHLTDGDRLKCKLCFVSIYSDDDDILVEVIETNQPEHYKDPNAVYAIPCPMIESLELCEP
jgi:hypothetical protein